MTHKYLFNLIALARISNSPTLITNVLAGGAPAGVLGVHISHIFLSVAMIAFYSAGMYLNDICDIKYDKEKKPDRPLPARLVSVRTAYIIVFLLFLFGSLLLFILNKLTFFVGLLLIFCIVLYNILHKNNPFSPIIMGCCRFCVYILSFLAFASSTTQNLFIVGGLLFLYIFAITAISKKEQKSNTLSYWPAAILLLPALIPFFITSSINIFSVLPVSLLYIGWTLYNIRLIYKDKKVGKAIGGLIAGIVLLDSLVLITLGSVTGLFICLLAFGTTAWLQKYIKGT